MINTQSAQSFQFTAVYEHLCQIYFSLDILSHYCWEGNCAMYQPIASLTFT